jgi:hypothetical protein
VTAPGGGRPLASRRLQPFERTRAALGVGLLLCCVGLARLAGAATITEFPLPTPNSGPSGITAGPDGALWFSEETGNKIGRITTALGEPPPPPAIPTLTEWGMIVLAGLVAGVMAIALRRRSAPNV